MIGAQLRRLGKHSAIYGLGGLVSRILAVLLLPLYTSYLTPSVDIPIVNQNAVRRTRTRSAGSGESK